jgi:hypothetical protein
MQFKVFLAIGNEDKSILIELMSLPYLSENYDWIGANNDLITDMSVTGWFNPAIHIAWQSILIRHQVATLEFSLPTQIKISREQSAIVKSIMANRYHTLLFTKSSGGNFEICKLHESVSGGPPPPTIGAITIAPIEQRREEAPPLYPSLEQNSAPQAAHSNSFNFPMLTYNR